MSGLNILYIGTLSGTCLDRANAYRRLGHDVTHWDMRCWLPSTNWVDRITWRLGGHLFSPWLFHRMRASLAGKQFDLCHVDNGEWMTPALIDLLRQHCGKVINYCIDDPTGGRDHHRFAAYRLAAPHYDLLTVVRQPNVAECRKLGARKVLRVFMSADELNHAPKVLNEAQRRHWHADVLFLGTWMPERGPFLLSLIERGVPLSIRGAHWHKAPQWSKLKPYWKGGPVVGDDYARAIQSARICLGLLSKGNRDLHTTRTFEIPALGGLLCAERTSEHTHLYVEGEEAIFWRDANECAHACLDLLRNEPKRQTLANKGRLRFMRSGYANEAVLGHILKEALS